jgi:hypothetical protein
LHRKQYFSSMDVEQYAWATEELVRSAEESVKGLEEDLSEGQRLVLLFIPLADFDPSGAYRAGPDMLGFICYPDGSIAWHFPPKDAAFANFEQECRSACDTLHAYLIRLLTYALAHGMDVAKANEGGNGRSILHPVPHSELHADLWEYDT